MELVVDISGKDFATNYAQFFVAGEEGGLLKALGSSCFPLTGFVA